MVRKTALILLSLLVWVMPVFAQSSGSDEGGGIPLSALVIVGMVILALVIRAVFGLGSRRADWGEPAEVDDDLDYAAPRPAKGAKPQRDEPHEMDYYLMERDLLSEDDRYYNDQAEEDFLGKQ